MKKLVILSAIALSGLMYNKANAQIGFHIGIRVHLPHIVLPAPPIIVRPAVYEEPAPAYQAPAADYQDQAPAADYQGQATAYNGDDYYYLPDVDAYYDVTDNCYYYNDGANWISAAYLPGTYANFDWRSARHFEIRGARPYLHDDMYRTRYNGQPVAEFARNNYNQVNNYGNQAQNFRGNDQRFYNRGPEHPAQQVQFNRSDFNRPMPQQNRDNGQHFENRGQDQRGGSEHLAQNNRENFGGRRMSKF